MIRYIPAGLTVVAGILMLAAALNVGCEQPRPQPENVPPAITEHTPWWVKNYYPQRELTAAEMAAQPIAAPTQQSVKPLPAIRSGWQDRPGVEGPSAEPAGQPAQPTTQVPPRVKPLLPDQQAAVIVNMKKMDAGYRDVWREGTGADQPLLAANVGNLTRTSEQLQRWAADEGQKLDPAFLRDADELVRVTSQLERVPTTWTREQVRPFVAEVTNACNSCHGRYGADPVVSFR